MNDIDILVSLVEYLNNIYENTSNAKDRDQLLTWMIALRNAINIYTKIINFKITLKELIG
jgi:hypothetical protein